MRLHLGKTPEKQIIEKIKQLILDTKNCQISLKKIVEQISKSRKIKRDQAIVYVYQCLANRVLEFDICLEELNSSTMLGIWDESSNRT
ncbi:hypothetical protein GZ77_00015 [Endozoicomonas montiporae]|uniref:Uncharacterized protein n=2 Tax=Endozoicomonas montiporae TaxID=1027273 RepID=A0A081N9L0_9GAMM|nr:hypothetical protein [Endozoicomonas montiporae]AMO54982.1 hypothetical protein EZMO1_0755 [Endozoicomonas montiporae CL-33]KEQ15133.1 hypothetical protein GZ77_00015 [Endozoicomonas montiporae]